MMFSPVVLVVIGFGLLLSLASPANSAAVKAKVKIAVPTKYAACKRNDCPSFRVVKKIADDIELREYYSAWWANSKAQARRINRMITTPLYWRLRRYLARNNTQKRSIKMGVPVTKLIETTKTGMKQLTMSFYLPILNPPQPSSDGVFLEHKSLNVYVKIFKGKSFYTKIGEAHARHLANELITHKINGTFYPPSVKYMTAGYDGPFIPRAQRTNEVWLIKRA